VVVEGVVEDEVVIDAVSQFDSSSVDHGEGESIGEIGSETPAERREEWLSECDWVVKGSGWIWNG
jgi:hypothetical protein